MDQLSVLHICNDFLWTKVHRNLYAHLDQLGVRQEIFTPLRQASNKENNRIAFAVPGSRVSYSGMLKGYHRVFFKAKIRKLLGDLEAQDIVDGCDIVHATTLFSDGALAWQLSRKYNKPYIVSIRNTDINAFLKYKPQLIFLAREILQHAEQLVFISQSNYDNFFQNGLVRLLGHDYKRKALVVNNGIDRAWLDNIRPPSKRAAREILFIGRFDANKNVLRLIDAFLALSKRRAGLTLRLVGGSGKYEGKVSDIVARNADRIVDHGAVASVHELMAICRRSDVFAMASHYETFGLVYIEALSQGLPILFSRRQGIDGTFSENVGVAVDSRSVADIGRGLETLLDHAAGFELHKLSFDRFSWESIAARYLAIYQAVLHER
jgi:glycosyltransferase involved in cell wall biosynthesis